MTGTDPLGRLVGKYVYSASNAFKIDKWHNLFLTKSHHPINITQEAYMELFDLAGEWFLHVNKVDPEYRYPQFAWDVLPKAGASQIHPHIHAMSLATATMVVFRLSAMLHRYISKILVVIISRTW